MLNSDTKRHIDAARQVLVGVVPNPTSQIEQITNALLYKFMDDMDQAAVKVGGKPSFFTGDLERYAWTRLMDTRVGNQARMNLYSEALVKFSQAEQLPKLFRDIFAGAFLPYRSPETLGLFLSEIDYFDYSHPEELGNAYEYLLSIMSSQGDAGQFRTPRNIIEFIVDVVNPTKDDKILDPACGTGGFLVSSYRHILEQHDGKDDPEKKEKPLTPEERMRLATNFEGYDIDPGMARIARVNMYLHQFKKPKIHQYDTLSSDERWRDKFSVILANPPFMSPKGGIRPHSKFSIPSSRSEVLFVDYIMEHLRPNGRAGIIVPEGIIFQSGTAYKQLRKKLVEDGLYAVVSLPGGVFQPYSGVKTSILLFNNEVAKQRKEILFLKVENDGFQLGANRRPINQNDLPTALDILTIWRTGEKSDSELALYVEKAKIAEDGEYNLTGERYRVETDYTNVKWPMVELWEVCEIRRGTSITKKDLTKGEIPVIAGGQQPAYYHSRSNRTGKNVTVSGSGAYAGFVNYFETPIFASDCSTIKSLDENKLQTKFCFYLLKAKQREIYKLQSGMGQPHVYPKDLKKFKIPLPPIEVQEQIVSEINQHQKVIDGAKQIVQTWKPYFHIDPEWPMVELGEIATLVGGGTPSTKNKDYWDNGTIKWLSAKHIDSNNQVSGYETITGLAVEESSTRVIPKGSIVFVTRVSVGKVTMLRDDYAVNQDLTGIILKSKNIDSRFLFYYLLTHSRHIADKAQGLGVKGVTKKEFGAHKIPLPPLKVQLQIVGEIEAEQETVDGCKALIATKENKINAKIAEVWGE